MAESGPLKDGDVDKLVLEYLVKRNFHEAHKVLELEIKASDAGSTAPLRLIDAEIGPVEGVLLAAAGGDATAYATEFNGLAAWVDSSLDMFKPELTQVLYPVLVHTYLNLIGLGATADARTLLATHKQRFIGAGADGLRAQELHDLQSLAVPEHLKTNRAVQALRSRRHPLRLCSFSYELLARFLQRERLFLMLGIINEHLDLDVFEGPPQGLAELAAGGEEGLAAPAPAEVAATNLKSLDLQLLRGGVEDQHAAKVAEHEETAAAEAAAAAAADDEAGKLSKRKKAQLEKAAAEAKTKRDAVGTDRMAPQIPIPAVDEKREAALLEELGSRAAVGPSALPSALFFTLYNTRQTLGCVSLSGDASRLVAGFADSSLRVYDLTSGSSSHSRSDNAAGEVASSVVGRTAGAGGAMWFRGHSAPVYAAEFSPDDQLLLSASADGTARLWSMELGIDLVAFKGHMLPVWDAAWAPYHGFYFATAGADRTARIWNTERMQALRILVGHQADVDVVRWHPNCHYLATGSSDRSVRLWDVRNGTCSRLLTGHRAAITSLAMSPDGKSLTSGDATGAVLSWDLGSARCVAKAPAAHAGPVWSLAYSQGEGSVLASGGADCTVKLWDSARGSASGSGGVLGQQEARPKEDAELMLLTTWTTRATPVLSVQFSRRNLMLCSGPLTLQRPVGSG